MLNKESADLLDLATRNVALSYMKTPTCREIRIFMFRQCAAGTLIRSLFTVNTQIRQRDGFRPVANPGDALDAAADPFA